MKNISKYFVIILLIISVHIFSIPPHSSKNKVQEIIKTLYTNPITRYFYNATKNSINFHFGLVKAYGEGFYFYSGALGISSIIARTLASNDNSRVALALSMAPMLAAIAIKKSINKTVQPLASVGGESIPAISSLDLENDPYFFELEEDEMEGSIKIFIQQLVKPSQDSFFENQPKKRICLIGSPGVGKTLYAKNIAYKLHKQLGSNVLFFNIDIQKFMSQYVDGGALNIKAVFNDIINQAKDKQAIIFIDELDAICTPRGEGINRHPHYDQRTNALLAELEGFNTHSNLIIIGATNKWESMDEAMRSRFGNNPTHISLPDAAKRETILKNHFKKRIKNAQLINKFLEANQTVISFAAQKTINWDGRDLRELVDNIILFSNHSTSSNELAVLDKHLIKKIIEQHIASKTDPNKLRINLLTLNPLQEKINEALKIGAEYTQIYTEQEEDSTRFSEFLSSQMGKKINDIAPLALSKTTNQTSSSYNIHRITSNRSKPAASNQNMHYLCNITKTWSYEEKKELADFIEKQQTLNKNIITNEINRIQKKHDEKNNKFQQFSSFSLPHKEKKYFLWIEILKRLGDSNLSQNEIPYLFQSFYLENPRFKTLVSNFLQNVSNQSFSSNSNTSVLGSTITSWNESFNTFNQQEQIDTVHTICALSAQYNTEKNNFMKTEAEIKKLNQSLKGIQPTWYNLYYFWNKQKRADFSKKQDLQTILTNQEQNTKNLKQRETYSHKKYYVQQIINPVKFDIKKIQPARVQAIQENIITSSLQDYLNEYNKLIGEFDSNKRWYHSVLPWKTNNYTKYQRCETLGILIDNQQIKLTQLSQDPGSNLSNISQFSHTPNTWD